jgi:nucleotide-binding universal stress UspA family protein
MTRKILAAIDDSAAATPVLRMAQAVAPLLEAEVHAMHVADGHGQTAVRAARAAGVPLAVVPGDPYEQLTIAVGADDVSGLVIGSRGVPSTQRPVGHLAAALATATVKPTVIVPPEALPPAQVRRVLIGMEATPPKARVLTPTIELAEVVGLELIVVNVTEEQDIPLFSDQVQYEDEAYANEFLSRFCTGAPSAQVQLRTGAPADELLAAVELLAPDLVAIGWPHTDDPARGQVARTIIERSHIPVLLVSFDARRA